MLLVIFFCNKSIFEFKVMLIVDFEMCVCDGGTAISYPGDELVSTFWDS